MAVILVPDFRGEVVENFSRHVPVVRLQAVYPSHELSLRLWADPTAYGFTNVTDAASACVGCDPNQYFRVLQLGQ